MRRSHQVGVVIATLVMGFGIRAAETGDCTQEIAAIDARIAGSPDAPAFNLRMAGQMKNALRQGCAFMDADARRGILENLDELLPPHSPEERNAAAITGPAAREFPVLSAPPTGVRTAGHLYPRDEPMHKLYLYDWDVHEGNLRVLYTTGPSRVQFGLPDWSNYVYVGVMTPTGEARQHLITSRQESDHAALALRRGYDEILFERRVQRPGEPSQLERWSISGRKLLGSVPTPNPAWTDGTTWDWQPFRLATSDGNVLFVSARENSYTRAGTLAWFKASAEGAILDRGRLESDAEEKLGFSAFFPTRNGGGGMTLTKVAGQDRGLASSSAYQRLADATRGSPFAGVITMEKYLYVVDGDAASTWQSPAIERMVLAMPKPGYRPPQSAEGMQAMLEGQGQLMDLFTTEFDSGRSTNSMNVGLRHLEMVKPDGDGYSVLTTVTANQSLEPPIVGPYLLGIDERGIYREWYLNPLAERLDAKLTLLEPARGGAYVHGASGPSSYVILLNDPGVPRAYAWIERERAEAMQIQGMLSDAAGVWLLGVGQSDPSHPCLWVERIAFP